MRIPALVLLAMLAATLAGCGSKSAPRVVETVESVPATENPEPDPAPVAVPSGRTFEARADAICARSFNNLRTRRDVQPEELAATYRRQQDELARLRPPRAERETFNRWLAAQSRFAHALRNSNDPTAVAGAGDVVRLATALGLKICFVRG